MRSFLTTKTLKVKSVIAVVPITWHQPRRTSFAAGSLIVEKVRSTLLRLAHEMRSAFEGDSRVFGLSSTLLGDQL